MTDQGERLRSNLAGDQSSASSAGSMADFDSPIAMEALRATRVLHAADQFHVLAAEACRTLGVSDPQAAGSHLLACVDGIVHDHLVGAASLRAEPPDAVAAAAATAIRAYLLGLSTPQA